MEEKIGLEVMLTEPYEQALETVAAALKTQGFGVLTRIDVRATMKEKLNAGIKAAVTSGKWDEITAKYPELAGQMAKPAY